jgi:predicted neuraminidase
VRTLLAAVAFGSIIQPPPDISLRVTLREFVYQQAPFPSAHASTIVAVGTDLVAAWFGGTAERNPDVGIWVSRRDANGWSPPVEVANDLQADGSRFPTWNPVLVQPPEGPLVLFYKVGPSPSRWWGMALASDDGGRHWQGPSRLPDGILGPIRAKPVVLDPRTLLAGSSTEDHGWVVHMERLSMPPPGGGASTSQRWLAWLGSADAWTRTGPLNDPRVFGAIQPTILVHSPSRLQILCRTRQGVIAEAWSEDSGASWSPMRGTTLPNPSAGIDSVRLPDGRFALVYNPTTNDRHVLAIATSRDGIAWSPPTTIEEGPGEYSYPAMIVAPDGRVHLTYTWRRQRIRHVVLEP